MGYWSRLDLLAVDAEGEDTALLRALADGSIAAPRRPRWVLSECGHGLPAQQAVRASPGTCSERAQFRGLDTARKTPVLLYM